MPVALVELIRAEQVLEVPAPNTSRDRAGWKVQQQRLVKDRMLVFVAVVIDVAVVANLVVGITALSQRSAALGVLTGIIALVVVLLVSALRHVVSRR